MLPSAMNHANTSGCSNGLISYANSFIMFGKIKGQVSEQRLHVAFVCLVTKAKDIYRSDFRKKSSNKRHGNRFHTDLSICCFNLLKRKTMVLCSTKDKENSA